MLVYVGGGVIYSSILHSECLRLCIHVLSNIFTPATNMLALKGKVKLLCFELLSLLKKGGLFQISVILSHVPLEV